MIFRLTQKLAKKIKEAPNRSYPAGPNLYTDWSAHLFTAQRVQYIIVSNTASLYSLVSYARGILDFSGFIKYFINYMAEYMSKDGYEFLFRGFIASEAKEVIFSKLTNRHVIGSVNNLVYFAKCYLIESQLSPFEASQQINQVPMSYLDYGNPKEAFAKMKPITGNTQRDNNDCDFNLPDGPVCSSQI